MTTRDVIDTLRAEGGWVYQRMAPGLKPCLVNRPVPLFRNRRHVKPDIPNGNDKRCKWGHAKIGVNRYVDSRGYAFCRQCKREARRRTTNRRRYIERVMG